GCGGQPDGTGEGPLGDHRDPEGSRRHLQRPAPLLRAPGRQQCQDCPARLQHGPHYRNGDRMTSAPLSGANLRGAVDLSSLVRPPTPATGAAPSGGLVRQATDATFTEILDLSSSVPVVVEFIGQGIGSALSTIVADYAGRLVLATVDATANPQLVQAF